MGKKKIAAAGILLVLVCLLAGLIYLNFKPQSSQGEKEITVTVIHSNQEEVSFTYRTNAEYLGEVLTENGLVEGSEGAYGLFITTADGETADESKQQWWCITKFGEQVNTSADTTPIQDKDTYELTLKEGY